MIDGVLYETPGEGWPHVNLRMELTQLLMTALDPGAYKVVPDGPLQRSEHSAPARRLYVFAAAIASPEARGPDALLVIEIADASLAIVLEAKAQLYAAFGVREHGVVDIPWETVHVFREPDSAQWRVKATRGFVERVEAAYAPGRSVVVAEPPRLDPDKP